VRTISRSTGVLIIAVMVAAVMFLSIPGSTMWRKVLQDCGHGPVFFVIGIALALMQEPPGGAGSRSFAILRKAFVIAAAIGVATELLQYFEPGRSVSAMDALHDAAGAALGLAVLAIVESRRPSPGVPPTSPANGRGEEPSPGLRPTSPASGRGEGRALALAIAIAALTLLAWQPLECALAYANRAAGFPVLVRGARHADLYFLRGRSAEIDRRALPARWRQPDDELALRVGYVSGARPALELFEPAPDWRGYRVLALDLTNPGATGLQFTLRILDAGHNWESNDRLNMPLVLPPQTRLTVRVAVAAVESAPAGRRMDLSRIANLMLFADGPAAGSEFYVSRIWLE
jgi:hypothetical protein